MAIVGALVVLLLLSAVHWYLWKRLVADVSAPGGVYRRVGTVVLVVMPVTTVLFQFGATFGLPFEVEKAVAWPGSYWIAVLLYLLLSLAVGEVLRPLLLRVLRRRDARRAERAGEPGEAVEAAEAEVSARSVAEREDEPVTVGAAGGPGQGAGSAGLPDAPERQAVPAGPADAVPGRTPQGAPGRTEPDRRQFVARTVAAGAGLVAAGTVGYGSYRFRQLTTKHVRVPLAKLPRAAHGYRIAVVSDIHLSAILGSSHSRRIVDAINRSQPDLITVVGDMVDAEVSDLRSAAAPLAELEAADGAYFVTGNHEYYVDTLEWVDHVRELGMIPLENARVELPFFDLAGVNDVQGEGTAHGGPDFEAALGDRDRQRASVLMAHQPVLIHDAVDAGVDLQLSGHTHGGQMWPVTYVADLANPTLAGLERYGDTQLYVSRGAGAWGPPVRVGADPDITVIELASTQT
ncbi:metallophosphoesterase [Streptomyces xiamenensis]|uniref:metallophosphoesterase n=1 Tax=Streptomyces xiamenensis TaxID=408015 RepID=UPI003D74977F